MPVVPSLYQPLFIVVLPASRYKMNINIRTQTQETIDDRAAQEFFPVAAGGLTQHDLCNLALACNLDQRPGNVFALHTYHLSTEVFSQHNMFFQPFAGNFS